MPNKTILLIEDDQFLSALIKTRLLKEEFGVLVAKSSDEAIKILQTDKPDLILMDIILPGKSGFEAMELIQSQPAASKIPVMIISNLGQEADIAKGKQLGAVEYFIKAQVSIDSLINKIKDFLHS